VIKQNIKEFEKNNHFKSLNEDSAEILEQVQDLNNKEQ